MNLLFIDVKDYSSRQPFLTVSRSGLITFNKAAVTLLGADDRPFLRFGHSPDKKDLSLYMQTFTEGGDGFFEIRKVKMGYVVNRAVGLLTHLGIDFKDYAYKFSVEPVEKSDHIFRLKEIASIERKLTSQTP